MELTEAELSFINKMKAKGFSGCSMTINNIQVYVSFYGNMEI